MGVVAPAEHPAISKRRAGEAEAGAHLRHGPIERDGGGGAKPTGVGAVSELTDLVAAPASQGAVVAEGAGVVARGGELRRLYGQGDGGDGAR